MADRAILLHKLDATDILHQILIELKHRAMSCYFEKTLIVRHLNGDVSDNPQRLFHQAMLTHSLSEQEVQIKDWGTVDLVSAARSLTPHFLTEIVRIDADFLFELRNERDEEKILNRVTKFLLNYVNRLMSLKQNSVIKTIQSVMKLYHVLHDHEQFTMECMLPLCLPHSGKMFGKSRQPYYLLVSRLLNNLELLCWSPILHDDT